MSEATNSLLDGVARSWRIVAMYEVSEKVRNKAERQQKRKMGKEIRISHIPNNPQ